LVGDSLTVLDRQDMPVRAALRTWGLLVAAVAGLVGAPLVARVAAVPLSVATIFGAALAVFLLEDTMRRLLMASMRFWALVLVDCVGLLLSLAVLVAVELTSGALQLGSLMVALLVGQVGATVTAVACLPSHERRFAPWRPSAMRAVAAYGIWRAAQQSVRPAMLTAARVLVTIAAGRAAFGQLEAARVYMAPALLVVQGLGTYLISSYASKSGQSVRVLVRRADIACIGLLLTTLFMGLVATSIVPWAGHLITGDNYDIKRLAVFGWAVYAASSAAVMPFASLAAVRGRQPLVLALRVTDSALSVGVVALLNFVLLQDISWTPYALAAGSFAGGAVIRRFVLVPLKWEEQGRARQGEQLLGTSSSSFVVPRRRH
jgi:hypothetical protein